MTGLVLEEWIHLTKTNIFESFNRNLVENLRLLLNFKIEIRELKLWIRVFSVSRPVV